MILLYVDFLKNLNFSNTIRVSNGLDPEQDLSVLIWVQTACKGYHQTTKVAADKKKNGVNLLHRRKFNDVL